MKSYISVVLLLAFIIGGCGVDQTGPSEMPAPDLAKNSTTTGWWETPSNPPYANGGLPAYTPSVPFCGTMKIVDLWAGQTQDAGSVAIYNDEANLYITVSLAESWSFTGNESVKIWAGADPTTLPTNNNGTPINGQFPFKSGSLNGQTTYTAVISLDGLSLLNSCGANIYVVIHADLISPTQQVETGYGGENGINIEDNGRWWYWTSYTIQCCDTPPQFDHEETAFAKAGWVFTTDPKSNPESLPSLNLTKNRWGWAINLTVDGTTTYDIWAGAGLNKIENGILVGTLTVTKAGSDISVTYNLLAGKATGEVHVYVGDFKPTKLAPGQYGHTDYFEPKVSTYGPLTFTANDTNGDGIWIIAHAVVAW